MTEHRMLELLALDCHHVGSTWDSFWLEHGERVRKVEPYDRARYRRLVRRLMALVVSGDTDGHEPISAGLLWGTAMPWETDDYAEASS
jgi:hypothetical protein